MKLFKTERIKHRVTGGIVILSMMAIFLPPLFKQSNHRLEETMNLSVRLPEKPARPVIAMANEKKLFQTVNVAQVAIPKITVLQPIARIVKAEPIVRPGITTATKPVVLLAKPTLILKPVVKLATHARKSTVKIAATPPPKVMAGKAGYAIQLGAFARQGNAQLLVNQLRSKGYKASYGKLNKTDGTYYQVLVGQVHQKTEAMTLRKRLADNLRLKGIIVKTGVS